MTAIHEEHAGALFAFVLRYVDDQDRASDVVQETLLRAWRHLDALDPDRRETRSYLFAVARNLLTDQWRAEQRRPRLVSDEGAMASAVAPDELAGAVEGWLVADAVDRLTPAHRAVIEALYFQGRTVADAAKLLDLPEGTIKSRSYYTVRTLRTIFEEIESRAMSTDHEQVHLLLGAYLLGGLGDTDRQAFEEHLPTCTMCRDELRRIAPVPGLLRRLQQPTLPPDQLLPALLSSVRAQRTRQR
ncbi:MAG: sigma-70 family RNA polymerase sigma factor [Dermatophilaceae bacterium]